MATSDGIPKSRITLTYRTEVQGQPQDVTLPFRLLIMGDLSGGTSADRKLDLDQRQVRNLDGKNIDQIMADMKISLDITIPNQIDPETGDEFAVSLPFESMKAFQPAVVADRIPKIRSLMLLKKLLLEVKGNLDNRKEFRKLVRALGSNPEAVKALASQLQGFESFKLPAPKVAGTAPAAPGGSAPEETP